MIMDNVTMLARHLKCNVCEWDWYSISKRLPDSCPNRDCRSREWNGKKQKRTPTPKPRIEFPKPNRIRTDEYYDEF